MKKIFFILSLAISTIFLSTVSYADTIYIGTGVAATSGKNGTTKNVNGTVTDADSDGYADGYLRFYVDDKTNKRDANWFVMTTDVLKSDWDAYAAGDLTALNGRRSGLEYVLEKNGSSATPYVQTSVYSPTNAIWGTGDNAWLADYHGSTGEKAKYGTVMYCNTADLIGNIGMNAGGLSNFAVSDTGVIMPSLGDALGYLYGRYTYNEDNSITRVEGSAIDTAAAKTTGFSPVQSGFAAFSTGFEMAAEYNYINGTFSVLGDLVGFYLNGTLLDSSLYYLSDNLIESDYAYTGRYNFELDLTNDFVASLLNADGNNNLAIMVLGMPLLYSGYETSNHGAVLSTDASLIALSADLYQNTNSITAVPEPAAILLWSLGSLGVFGYCRGRRRK
ncbi:MAG: hypothetical protein LBQ54_10975 [Planctomycetaceae bacterium]|jgi:hypothetical protein|nr:hypothetical protein [Planctomycetaceae bacterium]